MLLDSVLAIILLVSAYRGYEKGLASKLIGLAGIITSYVASWALYRPVGDILRESLGWPLLPACAAGGMLVFFAVTMLFSVADAMRRRVMQQHLVTLTALDRALGAGLGGAMGSVYALLVLFLAFLMPPDSALALMLQAGQSQALVHARPFTNWLTAEVGGAALGDKDLGRIVSRTLANPKETSIRVQALLGSPSIEPVLSDRQLMDRIRKGDLEAVSRDERVKDLFESPAAKGFLQQMSPDQDAGTTEAGKKTMLKMLGAVDRFRSAPLAQEILKDPEIQTLLKKGDMVALMRHKKVSQLLGGEGPAEDRQP